MRRLVFTTENNKTNYTHIEVTGRYARRKSLYEVSEKVALSRSQNSHILRLEVGDKQGRL